MLALLLAAQVVERVSLSDSGSQANGGMGSSISISGDGRFVAFEAAATNLVPGDTNGFNDIFVRDRLNGTIVRANVSSAGAEANSSSSSPFLSSDGRFVAFVSLANNLVAGDTNGVFDCFVRDLQNGTTERISLDSSGAQSNGFSFLPSLSADGRTAAFASNGGNLVAGDANLSTDIFVRDRQTGTTERVSVDGSGVEGNSPSNDPSISLDGRFVVFRSTASNLVGGDTNAVEDIFIRDRSNGSTVRVSLTSGGGEGNGSPNFPTFSADAQVVAFPSMATNMVPGDLNGGNDIFVRDRGASTTTRASVDSSGTEANGFSFNNSVSSDGRFVSFMSGATNLVGSDSNAFNDVFIHDRSTGTTVRANVASGGAEANLSTLIQVMSPDGRLVAFISNADNLVGGDTNGVSDVFVALNPLAPTTPARLLAPVPIGASASGGTRVRLLGGNFGSVSQVRIGSSFPLVEATASVNVLNSETAEFVLPSLSSGSKFIEVVESSGASDEIREALTISGAGAAADLGVLAGSTPQAYQMRSLPLFGSARLCLDQLSSCLGPADPTLWRAFVWGAAEQQYVELPSLAGADPDRELAGTGFWLISIREANCPVSGLSSDPGTTFYVLLHSGWNMVSLPSPGSVSWSSVRVGTKGVGSTGADDASASASNPFIAEFLFAWDGTRYASASQMIEGEAYWVYNKTGSKAVLFVPDPSPKVGDGLSQSYSSLPEDAPRPPSPPGDEVSTTTSAIAGGGGSGGGGGGDYAVQVGAGGTLAGILALTCLAVLLRKIH